MLIFLGLQFNIYESEDNLRSLFKPLELFRAWAICSIHVSAGLQICM